jgi:hypothetical protein
MKRENSNRSKRKEKKGKYLGWASYLTPAQLLSHMSAHPSPLGCRAPWHCLVEPASQTPHARIDTNRLTCRDQCASHRVSLFIFLDVRRRNRSSEKRVGVRDQLLSCGPASSPTTREGRYGRMPCCIDLSPSRLTPSHPHDTRRPPRTKPCAPTKQSSKRDRE